MTEAQLRWKFGELMKENDLFFESKLEKAILSGAFDLDDYEDNFVLPKIVMTAICKDLYLSWSPMDKGHKEEVENLRNFI